MGCIESSPADSRYDDIHMGGRRVGDGGRSSRRKQARARTKSKQTQSMRNGAAGVGAGAIEPSSALPEQAPTAQFHPGSSSTAADPATSPAVTYSAGGATEQQRTPPHRIAVPSAAAISQGISADSDAVLPPMYSDIYSSRRPSRRPSRGRPSQPRQMPHTQPLEGSSSPHEAHDDGGYIPCLTSNEASPLALRASSLATLDRGPMSSASMFATAADASASPELPVFSSSGSNALVAMVAFGGGEHDRHQQRMSLLTPPGLTPRGASLTYVQVPLAMPSQLAEHTAARRRSRTQQQQDSAQPARRWTEDEAEKFGVANDPFYRTHRYAVRETSAVAKLFTPAGSPCGDGLCHGEDVPLPPAANGPILGSSHNENGESKTSSSGDDGNTRLRDNRVRSWLRRDERDLDHDLNGHGDAPHRGASLPRRHRDNINALDSLLD